MRWALFACLALAGCVSTQPTHVWVRTDGQSRALPSVAQQFEMDRTICQGEVARARLSSGVTTSGDLADAVEAEVERIKQGRIVERGCMAERGYALIPEVDAEKKRAEFASQASPGPMAVRR